MNGNADADLSLGVRPYWVNFLYQNVSHDKCHGTMKYWFPLQTFTLKNLNNLK